MQEKTVRKVELDAQEVLRFLLRKRTTNEMETLEYYDYDNIFLAHQIPVITLGVVIALMTLIFRFTLFNYMARQRNGKQQKNNSTDESQQTNSYDFDNGTSLMHSVKRTLYQLCSWLNTKLKPITLLNRVVTPFTCLTVLWLFVSMKTFTELDLLTGMPGGQAMLPQGRQRKQSLFERNDTFTDLVSVMDPGRETLIEDLNKTHSNFASFVSDSDYQFENNFFQYVVEGVLIFVDICYGIFSLNELPNLKNRPEWRETLSSWEKWMNTHAAPVIQAILAMQLMIYLMSLMFNFRELFGDSPKDEPVKLPKSEIDLLKEAFERKQMVAAATAQMEETKDPQLTKISFKPQTGNKKEKDENIKLTDAQRKLQKKAINSLNKEIIQSQKDDESKKKSSCKSMLCPTSWCDFFCGWYTSSYTSGSSLTDFIDLGFSSPWSNRIDLQNTLCMVILIVISFMKVSLMSKGHLFLTFDRILADRNGFAMDVYEVVTNSPRLLAVFTMCLLSGSKFTGQKDSLDAIQYYVIRYMPSYIAGIACVESMIRKQMILTLDDFIFILLVIGVSDQKIIDSSHEKVQDEDLLLTFFRQKATLPPSEQGFTQEEMQKEFGVDADGKTQDGGEGKDFMDLLNMKIGQNLSMKEREKIYIAADLVQKNYLEMRQENADVNLDFMVDVFIDQGQRLNPDIDEIFKKQQKQNQEQSQTKQT